MKAHFILYVADQAASTEFYSKVLATSPRLNVPGMTEFELGENTVLGLMPEQGAMRLFKGQADVGTEAVRPSRAEVYLMVANAGEFHSRALEFGADEIDPLADRDWGHRAAYSRDRDGHILAFAETI